MRALLFKTDKWLSGLDAVLAVAAALCIVAMMLITGVDVVMRYAFNRPLAWAFDLLTHYLLVAGFFLGLSYTLRMNHHICVDFFVRMLPERFYQSGIVAGSLIAGAIFATVACYGGHDAYLAWINDEVIFGALIWPVWLVKVIIPLGMAPLALRCFHRGLALAFLMSDPQAQEKLGLGMDQMTETEA